MRLVFVDTNLLLLLIVGRTDRSYLRTHKRTADYDLRDLDFVEQLVGQYDRIATTPHVLAEASNLLRQIENPARDRIQRKLSDFVSSAEELFVAGSDACRHDRYIELGLTDAAILTVCAAFSTGDRIDLLTADAPIYNRALALGLPAELYA